MTNALTLKTTYESLLETLTNLENMGLLSFVDHSDDVMADGSVCNYGFWIDVDESDVENEAIEDLYNFLSGHCQFSSCDDFPTEMMEIDGVAIAWNIEVG